MRNYARMAFYFANLLRRTHWSRERLQRYRNEQVRKVVKYAFEHSQFYRNRIDKLGLNVGKIVDIDSLSSLPIVKREELQANANRLVSDEYKNSKLKTASTSGSIGKPFITYLSDREYDLRNLKQLRPHFVCGHKPRDRWVLITPPEYSGHVSSLQSLLGVYAPIPVSLFDDVPEQVSAINRLKPQVLDGYSSSLLLAAKYIETNGVSGIKPRMCMGGAELLYPADRAFMEKVFEAPYFDQYGSEEFGRIAWQCPSRDGYHLDFDTLVTQFVDKDGEEVAPGERGEVVCTSLFNYAMPLLRYAVGDVGVAPEHDVVCSCGITFPRMKMVEGRKDSIVTLPSGRQVPALVFGWMMEFYKYYHDIYQYRIIQNKRNSLRILIRKTSSAPDEKRMETELIRHVREKLGIGAPDVAVQVEFVEDIPVDKSGKLRKVISEV